MLAELKLSHLADSALPIGATAHSFGLETLVAEGTLTVPQLFDFLQDYLQESGRVEAGFCWRGAVLQNKPAFETQWIALNQQASAFKLSRESREASLTLGKRFLKLAYSLDAEPRWQAALQSREIHHALAFGLVGGVLGVDSQRVVLAYLHQTILGLVSACQRLMPLGQRQATQMIWHLKPTMIDVAEQASQASADDAFYSVTPHLDLASMRHPSLTTRLFIS